MSSYYDSVTVKSLQQKEQAFSLTNKLYDAGVWLSSRSSMYKGRSYIIDLNKTDEVPSLSRSEDGRGENKTHTYKQKLSATVGFGLKRIASHCDRKIKAKHVLVQELHKETPDVNLINNCRATILGKIGQVDSKKTQGEGADVGPELMIGCCGEFCKACCTMCCK